MTDQRTKMVGVGVGKCAAGKWYAFAEVDGVTKWQTVPYATELEAEDACEALNAHVLKECQSWGWEKRLTMLMGGGGKP